jgi:DNA-binding Lrp family transcriptional regulator
MNSYTNCICIRSAKASLFLVVGCRPVSLAFALAVKAYILVQAQLGKSRSVAKAIAHVQGVKMVHSVTGLYDVIAYLELADMDSLSDLVVRRIQTLKGVERTHTAIVV